MRGVTREEANYRIEGTRLRVEQGLVVGRWVCGHLFSGERLHLQRRGGTVGPMRMGACTKWTNPWTGKSPGLGCGMKQARKPRCGASRREAEIA